MKATLKKTRLSSAGCAKHLPAFTIVALLHCPILVCSAQAQTGAYTLNGGAANLLSLTENASNTDQSGVFVYNSGSLTVGTVSITSSGNASSMDSSSQYGINAAVLAGTSSGTVTKGTIAITGTANSIVTSGNAANGLFATGSGSSITMNGGSITTTGLFAHGVDVTYGGAITLNSVDITTHGAGCLATDFGGGTVTVTGGTMLAANTTVNSHVPGIYSTGTISVTGATVGSLGDYGGVIDGANSILLKDTALSGLVGGIKLWKTAPSFGNATVVVDGGSVTATAGDAIYVNGTTGNAASGTITVKNGTAISASTGRILYVDGGSTATFTTSAATLTGNLIADGTSSITAVLNTGSTLTGSVNRAAMTVDSTSVWNASADSLLASLTNSGTVAFQRPGLTDTISGAFSQTPTGRLSVLLGGASDYDHLAVTGAASLGGTLDVELASGFVPTVGESFQIITCSGDSGAFSTIATSDPGLAYSVEYEPASVRITITAVPEPATGAFLAIALLGLHRVTGRTVANGRSEHVSA